MSRERIPRASRQSFARSWVRGIRRDIPAPENFSGEVKHGFSPDFVGTDSTAVEPTLVSVQVVLREAVSGAVVTV